MAPFPRGAEGGHAACRRRRFRGRAARGGLRDFLRVGVRARVLLWGVSLAASESQRPDDLVCCVQCRRSGACFAWGRGFRHRCVAVPKSRGWGADFPWLVYVLWARRGVGGGARTLVPRAGVRVCVWALGALPLPSVVTPLRGASNAGRSPPLLLWARVYGRPVCPVRGGWCQALSLPRPPILWGGQPGFRDPCVPGAVGAGVGTEHRPHSVRPCGLALLAVGVAVGRPRGGAFCRCEGRLRSGAPLPRPPLLWGAQSGFRDPCALAAAGAGVGTLHRSHSVRPCGLVFHAVGVAGGRPRGGCLSPLRGASEVRRSPSLNCPLTGRAVGVRHPRGAVGAGVRVWGPSTVPLACMPCGGCVPRGWWGAVPGGVACHRCEGRLVSGPVPPPAARPLGRVPGVPRSVCPGCGRCGRGDPAPAPQRAPLRARVARCGGGGKGVPREGAFRRCERRLRSGAPPPSAARSLGGLSGSATHVVLSARVCGCGGPALSPWPACPVGAACRGGGGGPSPGGWPATVVRGVWWQAPSLPRPPVLWGGYPMFRDPCVPGAVGAGVGTQHRPHSVRPCGPALLAVGVAEGCPRGGCLSPL